MEWLYYGGTYTIKISMSILISIIGLLLGFTLHWIINKNKNPVLGLQIIQHKFKLQ